MLVVLACLAVGFAAVALPRALADRGQGAGRANPRVGLGDLADSRSVAAGNVLADTGEPEPPTAAAPTPQAAVEQFLAAEAGGDFATSYGLLSAADRGQVGSRSEWTTAHGHLPTITNFEIGALDAGAARAEVATSLTLVPELDEIVGLVPARADATWVALAEDGGWRVAFEESSLVPRYPSEDDAPSAARDWAADRRDCRRGDQYRGGLLGADALARDLCRAEGDITVGAAAALDPGAGAQPFLAAFGPEVFSWARVVSVTTPRVLNVVLAPVGERWLVVGVVEPSPGGSS
ncbi:MAG: hypothetical protein ACT4PI_08045 [Actinomycetota bacterium]